MPTFLAVSILGSRAATRRSRAATFCSRAATGAFALALLLAQPAVAQRGEPKPGRVSVRSLRDFEACQKQREGAAADVCLDALKRYVKKQPSAAFGAGKLVRVHFMHWEALEFFAPALRHKPSKKQCADPDVGAAVVSGLALPAHYAAVALAQELVQGTCRPQLEPQLLTALRGAGRTFRDNACATFAEPARVKRCETENQAATAEAPVPQLPTKSELMAKAPGLRETPPQRPETTSAPGVQRIEDVFPSLPPGAAGNSTPREIAELRTLDWTLLDLDTDSAELLRAVHGEELLMAHTRSAGARYVLLKFKGIKGPWNERVLVAIERARGTGKEYVVLQDEREAVVMVEQERQYQAFPKGIPGGLWLSPVRPSEPTVMLPTRREIATELAAAPVR